MRLHGTVLRLILSGVLIAGLITSQPVYAEQRTITGTLNESEQLVSARGDVYEIADTEAGTAMLYEAAEDVVQVTGEVVEDEEINIITVSSFKVLATSSLGEAAESAAEEEALEDALADDAENPEEDPGD